MIAVIDEFLAGRADFVATVGVHREVRLKGVVLLQQALHGSHVLAQIRHCQQLLLFGDPVRKFLLSHDFMIKLLGFQSFI